MGRGGEIISPVMVASRTLSWQSFSSDKFHGNEAGTYKTSTGRIPRQAGRHATAYTAEFPTLHVHPLVILLPAPLPSFP